MILPRMLLNFCQVHHNSIPKYELWAVLVCPSAAGTEKIGHQNHQHQLMCKSHLQHQLSITPLSVIWRCTHGQMFYQSRTSEVRHEPHLCLAAVPAAHIATLQLEPCQHHSETQAWTYVVSSTQLHHILCHSHI